MRRGVSSRPGSFVLMGLAAFRRIPWRSTCSITPKMSSQRCRNWNRSGKLVTRRKKDANHGLLTTLTRQTRLLDSATDCFHKQFTETADAYDVAIRAKAFKLAEELSRNHVGKLEKMGRTRGKHCLHFRTAAPLMARLGSTASRKRWHGLNLQQMPQTRL